MAPRSDCRFNPWSMECIVDFPSLFSGPVTTMGFQYTPTFSRPDPLGTSPLEIRELSDPNFARPAHALTTQSTRTLGTKAVAAVTKPHNSASDPGFVSKENRIWMVATESPKKDGFEGSV